jgi:murein DD-endopeptidase MepM/ murein hydrolase activator NlpD
MVIPFVRRVGWPWGRLPARGLLVRQCRGYRLLVMVMVLAVSGAPEAIAQTASADATGRPLCSPPVLSRLTRYRVTPGETLEAIAQRYRLLPATLMGLNPSAQGGSVRPGQELLVPPYNGIRVSVAPGHTWEQVAQTYNSRADVLFEVNGCVSMVPAAIFVPGVNWFPGVRTVATGAASAVSTSPLQGYPLPQRSRVVVNYGWQPDGAQGKLVFNTGVALAASPATAVLAVGPGTVAFAGADSVYGNLVVVNHDQGLQTRYANLGSPTVRVGQTVQPGDRLGPVASQSGRDESFVFFEVRLNSAMGWVAQNPQDYVPAMALR